MYDIWREYMFINYLKGSIYSSLSTSLRVSNMSIVPNVLKLILNRFPIKTRPKWCSTWQKKIFSLTSRWTPPSPRCRRPWGCPTCLWGKYNCFKLISPQKLGRNDVRHDNKICSSHTWWTQPSPRCRRPWGCPTCLAQKVQPIFCNLPPVGPVTSRSCPLPPFNSKTYFSTVSFPHKRKEKSWIKMLQRTDKLFQLSG